MHGERLQTPPLFQVPSHLVTTIPLVSLPEIKLVHLGKFGLRHLEDILEGHQLRPLESLTDKYAPPHSTFFILYQIYHFLKASSPPTITLHPKIWQFFSNFAKPTKETYLIYKILPEKN